MPFDDPPPLPPADDEQRARAGWCLRNFEEELALARTATRLTYDRTMLEYMRAWSAGAVEALYRMGLLYDRDRLDWLTRLDRAGSIDSPDPQTELTGAASRVTPTSHDIDPASPPRAETRAQGVARSPSLTTLRVAIAVDAAWSNEINAYLVETWDDGVVVRWSTAWKPLDVSPTPTPRIDLHDDVQTPYRWVGGAAGGGGAMRIFGHSAFVPAVPASARSLVLVVENERIRVSLDGG